MQTGLPFEAIGVQRHRHFAWERHRTVELGSVLVLVEREAGFGTQHEVVGFHRLVEDLHTMEGVQVVEEVVVLLGNSQVEQRLGRGHQKQP